MSKTKPTRRPRAVLTLTGFSLLIFSLLASGCHPRLSANNKKQRAELRSALRSGDYERATVLARAVAHDFPKDNGAWERLAMAQFGTGDLAGLRETLDSWKKSVSRTSPKFDEDTGDLALAEGDRAQAWQSWSKAVAAGRRTLRVWQKMARLQQEDRRWAEAITAWNEVIKLQESAPALLARAACFREQRDWDSALRDVARARAIGPDDPAVARANAEAERLREALPALQDIGRKIASAPGDAALLADRALLLLRAGLPELALEDAEEAGKRAPTMMKPRLFRAQALLALGRGSDAEKMPVRNSPRLEFPTPEFLDTISQLDAQISAEPRNAEIWVRRAWALNEMGQPALALEDAEQALQLEPKSSAASAEGSYALSKLGRSPAAYDWIKRATELDPNSATAWLYRGELEMQRVDYLTAIESLTRALSLNQSVVALQKREASYRKVGLLARAAQDHDAAAQLSAPAVR